MDFSTIGSINQYVKGVALKTQWNLKKKSGDVTRHIKGLDDFLSAGSSQFQTDEDADNEKLQKITNKVNVGAKLTEKEMEYLKGKNPQLYEKLRQIEKEQKAYEEALRHCKSKDEAQRLHMARMGEAMEAAKNGDGMAAYRMNRMNESMTAFTKTGEYKKLPAETEQALERKEEKEEREAEQPDLETSAAGERKKAAQPKEAKNGSSDGEATPTEADSRTDDAPKKETLTANMQPEGSMAEAAKEHSSTSADARFGTRAYVASQTSEEQEKRRRAIDAKA